MKTFDKIKMIDLSVISNENSKNDLIASLEEFKSRSLFNKLKLEKIIESAIHWSLANGEYLNMSVKTLS